MLSRSIQPNMAAGNYKTYQIAAPRSTHFRPGSCEEAQCSAHLNGWKSLIDETTDLGQKQAHYIRRQSGRKFTETKNPAGITEFCFEAGQTCFRPHNVSLERPPIYIVRDGDFRGNPRGTDPVFHSRPENWVEDFAIHQDKLSTAVNRG